MQQTGCGITPIKGHIKPTNESHLHLLARLGFKTNDRFRFGNTTTNLFYN